MVHTRSLDPQTAVLAHPTSCPVGLKLISTRIKQPEREADISPPSRPGVKNECSYTAAVPYNDVTSPRFLSFELDMKTS
jgi:hypothetical protein